MKVKMAIMCTLTALATLIFGCALVPGKASVNLSCEDFTSQNHILGELSMKAGDSFSVTLCSNPSTGFQWESAVISDPSVLTETSHQYIGPESDPAPPPGTPGQDVWTFRALKKGTSTISIYYSRPWEGGEKGVWTFTTAVTVK